MTDTHRYSGVAIALHWVIALAILSLIPAGWFMGDLPNEHALKEPLYQLHKSVGITVLILTIARIAWRIMNRPPEDVPGLKGWEAAASHAVHWAFYGLMLAMPLSGWLYVSTAHNFDIPTVLYGIVSWPDLPFVGWLSNEAGHNGVEFVHSKLAWLAIGLVALHVAGAIKHEIGDEEGVMKRMIPGLFGKTSGPRAPSRGAGIALASAIGVFAAVAALPVLAQSGSSADLSGNSGAAVNWQVNDTAENMIAFSGLHDGNTYTGGFNSWSAQIYFDIADLEASRADVIVDLSSASASQKLYEDSLKAPEWFNVTANPTASVAITGFSPGAAADTYVANAALTLKEVTVSVPINLAITIDGDVATVTGSTTLSRSALNLGMQSDPTADWVADAVSVNVNLSATRITD